MKQYTDNQLKQALAMLLPDRIVFDNHNSWTTLRWANGLVILDTELLHLCWMVEDEFKKLPWPSTWQAYATALADAAGFWYDETEDIAENNTAYHARLMHATWQQRVIALAKVKNVEIP